MDLSQLIVECPQCASLVSAAAEFQRLLLQERGVRLQAVPFSQRSDGKPILLISRTLTISCDKCHEKRRILTPLGQELAELLAAQESQRLDDETRF